jgi:hypothetical protein
MGGVGGRTRLGKLKARIVWFLAEIKKLRPRKVNWRNSRRNFEKIRKESF